MARAVRARQDARAMSLLTRRHRRALILVGTLVVLAISACSVGARPTLGATTTVAPRTVPRPKSKPTVVGGAGAAAVSTGAIDVAVVGDSLTVGIQDTLPRDARDRGFTVQIDAKKGREIPEGVKVIEKLVPGKDMVVIALGTNDARGSLDAKAASLLIEQALDAVGTTLPVLWVNVYRDPKTEAGRAAQRFNAALEAERATHPNLTVADWATAMNGNTKIMSSDGIHLSDDGYKQRSTWVAEQIVDLATRLTPT
jgi:GDSL-like Lipase/Acylhydrolase family